MFYKKRKKEANSIGQTLHGKCLLKTLLNGR